MNCSAVSSKNVIFLSFYLCLLSLDTRTYNLNYFFMNIRICFYVLLIVHLRITLGNDQLATQLLYFAIGLLRSCTCFAHYMLTIRRLNCIDAASGIVTLSKWPFVVPDGHLLRVTIPDTASIQFNLLMVSI